MRTARPIVAALVALALAGCFENDPVSEQVTIEILPEEKVEIRTKVEVSPPASINSRVLAHRASETRSELAYGQDAWSRRFGMLRAEEERHSVRKTGGEIVSVERSATVGRSELPRFFADTALTFLFLEGAGWSELVIYPGNSTHATEQEHRAVSSSFTAWSTEISRYLDAVASLYSWLELHPERAGVCFAALFDGVIPEEMRLEDEAELTEEEAERIEALFERMEAVAAVLRVGQDESYSLDRASRLVFDPFPADLSIVLPRRPLEVAGFVESGEQSVRVPRVGLWEAFETVEGRWVSPNPITVMMQSDRDGRFVDLDMLTAQPRQARRASPEEVRGVIEQRLRPQKEYRVRWPH